jgi:hypothetical protein
MFTVHRTTVGFAKFEVREDGDAFPCYRIAAGGVPAADNPSLDAWPDRCPPQDKKWREIIRHAVLAGTVIISFC